MSDQNYTTRRDSFNRHLKGVLHFYISDRAKLLNLLLERGLNEAQIARELGVSRESVNNMKVVPYED